MRSSSKNEIDKDEDGFLFVAGVNKEKLNSVKEKSDKNSLTQSVMVSSTSASFQSGVKGKDGKGKNKRSFLRGLVGGGSKSKDKGHITKPEENKVEEIKEQAEEE